MTSPQNNDENDRKLGESAGKSNGDTSIKIPIKNANLNPHQQSSTQDSVNVSYERLEGSRFHVLSSKRNNEDFTFDEQFMIDAITEHYRSKKSHMSAKKVVYRFLNFPSTMPSYMYHIFTFMLCAVTIILSMVYDIDGFKLNKIAFIIYVILEFLLAGLFLAELILHVWCCDVKLKYKKNGRLTYLYTIHAVIDMLAILCFIVKISIILHYGANVPELDIVIIFQMLQIVKLLHYERYNNTLKIMVSIAWRHRKEILSSYLLILYLITTLSFMIYLLEHKSEGSKLKNLPDSFYYAAISFTTVGYGDIYPITYAGKILITMSAILGLSLVAVPSGIIGSGFALQLAYEEKKKRVENRQLPAIILIQNAWRRHCLITRGRSSKYFKQLYVKLTTYGGSIIQHQPLVADSVEQKCHKQYSTMTKKRSNFVMENYNPVDNSATVTVYGGSKNKQGLTYIKIFDHISNTRAYKNVFLFLLQIKLSMALKNFKAARKQDTTLENMVCKIFRQNHEMLHQQNRLLESFHKAFNKPQGSLQKNNTPLQHSHSAVTPLKRAGKVDSVVNLNSNIIALDARLNRIEHVLKKVLENTNRKDEN